MQAATIDEVITLLDTIIADSKRAQDRIGFFAALYRRVSVAVRDGIVQGKFDDGPRMEKLDVTFANRYFAALTAYQSGQPLTTAWKVAFDAARQPSVSLLQHLLLGMNAHINLDLGLAAAEVAPGAGLDSIQRDFFKINMVLASLVGECVREFGVIWPIITWANTMLDTKEELMVAYEIDAMRNYAWRIAQKFGALPVNAWEEPLRTQDEIVHVWGQDIWHPWILIALILALFTLTNRRSVAATIDVLISSAEQVPIRVQPENAVGVLGEPAQIR
jgi:hypothetical protein